MFTSHSYSLSNYAGQVTLLRFNYSLPTGSFNTFNGADNYLGWSLENITVTNVQQFIGATTNTTVTTNFTFTPAQLTNYFIAAAPVLFTQFPLKLGAGQASHRHQQSEHQPSFSGQPVLTNKQVQINFTVSGAASTFHLLQTTNLAVKFVTNTTATFLTNTPGISYRYTATNTVPVNFYRVQTP